MDGPRAGAFVPRLEAGIAGRVALRGQSPRDVTRLARTDVVLGARGPDRAHLVVVHEHLVQPHELVAVLGEQRRALLAHRGEVVERGPRTHLGELVHEQRTAHVVGA